MCDTNPTRVDRQRAIEGIVDTSIRSFAEGLMIRHLNEVDNAFISELGDEYVFYSALVRGFESSLDNTLEAMGNNIAKLTFETIRNIHSYILPAQLTLITDLIQRYTEDRVTPEVAHYSTYTCVPPRDLTSFQCTHRTNHCFIKKNDNDEIEKIYVIELKSGGDLDKKKVPAEKEELLKEYFMLKNLYPNVPVQVYFAVAYGEGNTWDQSFVRRCFADEELLIGQDYWNFICHISNGFNIVINQYRESMQYIIKKTKERLVNV